MQNNGAPLTTINGSIIIVFAFSYKNQFDIWGDFLRSVPCVTVWHQKIKFYTVSAGEKSLKTYLVYVPMITKNCRGHLPDRSYLDTGIVHVTQWRFWENISKKHFLDKKIHISTYKMHFRVVVAVNLKSFTFCNSNIHVTQWLFQ